MSSNILEQATKPVQGAAICTITGDAGVGKTSLAATWPQPVFIRVEDGMQSIPQEKMPDALPVVDTVDMFWDQLTALVTQSHNWKTVVIDSVTRLERLFIQHVLESDPKAKSINQALGGYGAGLQSVGAMHGRVRKAAELLKKKGINTVFIAHSETTVIELPDQDPYTRYVLRLGRHSMAPYVDDVDLVGYMKLETFTSGDGDRKKAISDGTRILTAYTTAANISKNRYGITRDLVVPLGENPLAKYIKSLQQEV